MTPTLDELRTELEKATRRFFATHQGGFEQWECDDARADYDEARDALNAALQRHTREDSMTYQIRMTPDHLGPAATDADLSLFADHFNNVVEREGMDAGAWVEHDRYRDPVAVRVEIDGMDEDAAGDFVASVINGNHGTW